MSRLFDNFEFKVSDSEPKIIYWSEMHDPETWDDGITWEWDCNTEPSPWLKENEMNLTADFEGKIKRIGNQFLLKLGCQEFICQTLSDVGKKITVVLQEEYKKKDTPDEDE